MYGSSTLERIQMSGHEQRSFGRSGPARGAYAPLAFSIVNVLSIAVLYGRAGRLTPRNGGFRPGQNAVLAPRLPQRRGASLKQVRAS
jgi:hypothetical protein